MTTEIDSQDAVEKLRLWRVFVLSFAALVESRRADKSSVTGCAMDF